MSGFVGFKDGKTFVFDEHIEGVRLEKRTERWVIVVYLRYPNGETSEYSIYREANELEAKERLNYTCFLCCHFHSSSVIINERGGCDPGEATPSRIAPHAHRDLQIPF